jgi:hypothetical protein
MQQFLLGVVLAWDWKKTFIVKRQNWANKYGPGGSIGDSAPQTDSNARIGLGRRIFPLETVWWGAETSAGICGHLLNFIGPQKLGFQIFEVYFIIFMLFLAVLLCF